jgi:flagellar hook-associated protein 3 FlgL
MVSRVSTAGSYSAILANLMAAEGRQTDAENRVSSQKNGDDLKAFSTKAETLSAMRTVNTRLTTYQSQNDVVAAKLTVQDGGLNQVADSATAIRQAIEDALASDSAADLMQQLGSQFSNAVDGMNTQYDGKYVFAGGQIDTKPVTATSMADLTSGPPISSFFKNDSFKTQAKISDATTVTTGVLASDVGTDLMTGLQTIQAFNDSGSGPLDGPLTDAQRTFLQNQLTTWGSISDNATQVTAQNGLVQQRVDQVKTDLVSQSNTLAGMMGDITDADMAKAATDLSSAQLAVQASAQVLQVMQSSSLLNFLQAG